MSASLSIRRVSTRAEFEQFITFPWTVYKGNRYWVPPFPSMQRHKFDRQKGAAWEYMEGEYFIAQRDGYPVGTIAAFINHRHNDYWNDHIGFFGQFELLDDQDAAHALLDTAADYVAGKGYDAVRGPATFSTNAECGVLTEGFDEPPVLMYPYNPPYYQRLIENAPGFAKVMELYAYHITLDRATESPTIPQMMRITAKNSEKRGITVRLADSKNLKAEFELLKDIYNKAWEKNWGFVPFSPRELDEMVEEIGRFFDPRMAFFAEVEGKTVAFLLALPDMNQALLPAYPRPGKPEIASLLHLLWAWKVRGRVQRVRIMLLGVEEGYRSIGVEAALFVRAYEAAAALGRPSADGGWVLETNDPMNRLVEAFRGQLYKRFRFYERPLTAQAATTPVENE